MKVYQYRAIVRFYKSEEGGRVCMPIGDGYAPYLRSGSLPEDLPVRVCGLPADGVLRQEYGVTLECTYHPKLDYSPLPLAGAIKLIEGAKVVGEGWITSQLFESGGNEFREQYRV